jgi:peptide/nickel transport system substrate-binding protein
MRGSRNLIAVAITGLLAVGVSACGSSSSSSSSGGGSSSGSSTVQTIPLKPGEDPTSETLTGKKGGTLTVLSNSDFQHFDPGSSYYSLDYPVVYAIARPLFSYAPNNAVTVRPDLATTVPTTANGGVTDGGKTVTVHIRSDVRFSPPVNRAVTSADVAYAIERGANPNVGNSYFPAYFGSGSPAPLVGATSASYKGGPIPGINTPNKTTIVFHLTKPGSTLLINALSLPLTAPEPQSFVAPLDKHAPTTYGTQYLVSTGPYMVQADKTGKIAGLGFQPGKAYTLVRNPNWKAATDFRPAYLDEIKFNIGGSPAVIGQQVLKGSSEVQLDTVDQPIVKLAYEQYPSQITFTPGSGTHYMALDNAHGPFQNVNLRRAVFAGLNRAALVKARGGSIVADPMTHFIYPSVAGFDQAGGLAGPQVDFNKNVNGDMAVATKYMKAAGFKTGKYTGSASVQVVGVSSGNGPAINQIINSDLTSLGFKTHVSAVDDATMYSKYCEVPKQEIDVCDDVGWIRDFADPLSVLYPTFYGPSIVANANVNYGQVNDPAINAAIRKAAQVVDPTARAQAWGNVDKMLVDQAVAIPATFDKQPNIESKNVHGVDQLWNIGEWDFSFTSLK